MKQKDNGDSAAAKLARKKAARVDKTGASGMGMNMGGVKARAKSAGLDKSTTLYPSGVGSSDSYSGLREWQAGQGTPSYKGKKITDKQADNLILGAENKVRANYGVSPKKKKSFGLGYDPKD